MFGLSTKELIIIAIILVFLFGAKKIPQLFKSIADGIKQLRGINTDKNDENKK